MDTARKPLQWIGSARRDLKQFGAEARWCVGIALNEAQIGNTHPTAKPLSGFGSAKVLEIVVDSGGDTYRAVYTVRFPGVVYVLHAFQKKSTRGIATPRHEMDVIRARLREAERRYGERWRIRERTLAPYGVEVPMDESTPRIEFTPGSGNVFADLDLPNADQLLVQANLMSDIMRTIRTRRISREHAAELMGIAREDVDDIEMGRVGDFPVERLRRVLTTLRASAGAPERHGRVRETHGMGGR